MLADAIARWLTQQGVIDYRPDALGGTAFVGYTPSSPDACVALFDDPGAAPDPKLPLGYPDVQISARGAAYDYRGPHQALQDIFGVLEAASYLDLHGGIRLLSCDAQDTYPQSLGMGRDNRWSFVQNYDCRIVRTTAHRTGF